MLNHILITGTACISLRDCGQVGSELTDNGGGPLLLIDRAYPFEYERDFIRESFKFVYS